MSTLDVTKLKSKSSGTPTEFVDSGDVEVGQLCKAWVNFNGVGTVAIRDSFNVSSITDNNTGRYTVNFTNNMTDANYSIISVSSGANGDTIGGNNWAVSNASEAVSTSEAYVGSQDNSSDAYYDCTNVNVAVFSN